MVRVGDLLGSEQFFGVLVADVVVEASDLLEGLMPLEIVSDSLGDFLGYFVQIIVVGMLGGLDGNLFA